MIGHILRNYQILEKIGEGGMGTVYKAQHLSLNRIVAIKSLNKQWTANPEIIHRFKNEAKILANLQHPNIITLYDYIEDITGYYLIMEYFDGMTLSEYIHKITHKIPENQAILIFEQLVSAFAYAHSQGIIHRDIKPSNILINSKLKVKILDFGIAKMKEISGITKTGSKIGTIMYMSPEQIQSLTIDHRTDIYSLGIVLWEMVTGKFPYDENTQSEFEISNAIVHNALPHPKTIHPNCSDKIHQIIQKCTAKNPNQRYPSCEQIRVDTLFYYPELFQKSSPNKKLINSSDAKIIEEKPFPWKIILGITLFLIANILVYFLFFYHHYTEQDIKKRILTFYDKMNRYDLSIQEMVEAPLKEQLSLSNLRKAGFNQVDTSSFVIKKNHDSYKVTFKRKIIQNQQETEKNTTFFLRDNDLKIFLIYSQNIHPKSNKSSTQPSDDTELEIIHFIQMFYQYADDQNIEGLIKCYDNIVEKWFLEKEPVSRDYIRKQATEYIKKVKNEITETYDYEIKNLSNNRYEVHYKIHYSYELRKKNIQKSKRYGVYGDAIMKVRRDKEDFKVYYLELRNQKMY